MVWWWIYSSDKHREGASTQQLRDELAGLRGQLRAQTNSEARWRAERTSLLAQIETLNEQLVRSQHRIDAMEADNRRMMHVRQQLYVCIHVVAGTAHTSPQTLSIVFVL